jgi:preprotein translocase subunit SecG
MLNDKQTLLLSGIMVSGIFIFGILNILENFVVLTVLTIVFFTILINMFYLKSKSKEDTQEQDDK